MALTEEERHELYQRLEEVLGHDEATTLMEHLPPAGWADVATKRDLDQIAREIRLEVRADIKGLEARIATSQRTLALTLSSLMLTGWVALGTLIVTRT